MKFRVCDIAAYTVVAVMITMYGAVKYVKFLSLVDLIKRADYYEYVSQNFATLAPTRQWVEEMDKAVELAESLLVLPGEENPCESDVDHDQEVCRIQRSLQVTRENFQSILPELRSAEQASVSGSSEGAQNPSVILRGAEALHRGDIGSMSRIRGQS